jgi:ABC-type polysaccharide/polyol phosphate transport system ATPase subunit
MYIKSASFKEILAFSDVSFEFGHNGHYAGWNVFVGGNASGKSTVLK